MNWRKAPPIIREIRIAYLIPEIRWSVCGTIGWRVLTWLSMPITAAQVFIPILLYLLGAGLHWLGEKLLGLPNLYGYCQHKRRESIRKGHEEMTPAEIQARVYN